MLNALFPQTRQNILATLLLSPERGWYLSDLAHHLGVPPSSLQRELTSLTDAGILNRTSEGNRVYYQANAAFPLLPELQSLFAKTIGLADQVRATLQPFEDGIDLAFIYGSVARGERTASSDVDILIVGSVSMADLALPLRELERSLQIPINVTHFTRAEYQDKWRQQNHFLTTIMRGKKIYLKGSDDELADTLGEPEAQSAIDEQAGVG